MSNNIDREAMLREPFNLTTSGDPSSGTLGTGSSTGDMSNNVDRETVFRGGGAVSNTATIDRAAGGMSAKSYQGRGGLSVYSTDNYEQSSAKAFTGGLGSAPIKGGRNSGSNYSGKSVSGARNAGVRNGSNPASMVSGGATTR